MRARYFARTLAPGLLLAGLWGCGDADDPGDGAALLDTEAQWQLTPVGPRYGWGEPREGELEGDQEVGLAHGGGMLGRVGGFDVSEAGDVFVLDPQYQKVVKFSVDGERARVFVGGLGSGPGEFRRPRTLSVDADGHIWVIDDENLRVTRFRGNGELVDMYTLAPHNIHNIVVSGDTIFAHRRSRQVGAKAMLAYHWPSGAFVDSAFVTDAVAADLSDFGEPGALGGDWRSGPLWAHPSPGVWGEHRRRSGEGAAEGSGLKGRHLHEDVRGAFAEVGGAQARYVPISARGIAAWRDGGVVISYTEIAEGTIENPPIVMEAWLLFMDRFGEVLARVPHPLPGGNPRMRTDPEHGRVLLASTEPFPHVQAFQVSEP